MEKLLTDLIYKISIHAPRVGSDNLDRVLAVTSSLFQSTLPVWGATFLFHGAIIVPWIFQSTLPVWGATNQLKRDEPYIFISIHAPRVGSDL